MAGVIWSATALADLRAMHAWIAREAPRTALRFVDDLVMTVDGRLARQPMSGRQVPEWPREDLRLIPYGCYRIIYRIREGSVAIAAIHHSARLLDRQALERIERDLEP